MLLETVRRSLSYTIPAFLVLAACLFIQNYYFTRSIDPLLVIYNIARAFYGDTAQ